jgi:hypothetical protein
MTPGSGSEALVPELDRQQPDLTVTVILPEIVVTTVPFHVPC